MIGGWKFLGPVVDILDEMRVSIKGKGLGIHALQGLGVLTYMGIGDGGNLEQGR